MPRLSSTRQAAQTFEPARSVSALPLSISLAPAAHICQSIPKPTLNSPMAVPGLGRCCSHRHHDVYGGRGRRRAHAQHDRSPQPLCGGPHHDPRSTTRPHQRGRAGSRLGGGGSGGGGGGGGDHGQAVTRPERRGRGDRGESDADNSSVGTQRNAEVPPCGTAGRGYRGCLSGPGRALGGWGRAGQLRRVFLNRIRPSGPPTLHARPSVASKVESAAHDALISPCCARRFSGVLSSWGLFLG